MTNFDKCQTHSEAIVGWNTYCAQYPLCVNCPYYEGIRFGETIPQLKCFFKWLKDEYTNDIKPEWLKDLSNGYYKNNTNNEEENDGR